MPKKIFGLDAKVAIGIFLVVLVGVYLYIKHKGTGIATQTQTTPQVAATGQQDATGAANQPPDLSALLEALAQQTAAIQGLSSSGYNTPVSYPGSPGTDTGGGSYTGASPPAPPGTVNVGGTVQPVYQGPGPAGVYTPPSFSTPTVGGSIGSAIGAGLSQAGSTLGNASYAGTGSKDFLR